MKRTKRQAILESLIVFFMTTCISSAGFMTIIYATDESDVYSKPQLHIEMSEPSLRSAAPVSVNIFERDEFLNTFRVPLLKSSKENLLKAQPIVDSIISEIAGERPDEERIVLAAEKIEELLEFNREYSLTGMSDALVDGQGVCWHYAYLYDAILKAYGYDSEIIYIRRDDKEDAHVINRVTINGEQKYFDVGQDDIATNGRSLWMSEEEAKERVKFSDYLVLEGA